MITLEELRKKYRKEPGQETPLCSTCGNYHWPEITCEEVWRSRAQRGDATVLQVQPRVIPQEIPHGREIELE